MVSNDDDQVFLGRRRRSITTTRMNHFLIMLGILLVGFEWNSSNNQVEGWISTVPLLQTPKLSSQITSSSSPSSNLILSAVVGSGRNSPTNDGIDHDFIGTPRQQCDGGRTIGSSSSSSTSRRRWMSQASAAVLTAVAGGGITTQPSYAIGSATDMTTSSYPSLLSSSSLSTAEATLSTSIEMKDFVDPQGLFSLRVPKSFYALRRSAKGDLPDSKTGKGRRGSSIFTAGNMAKAEVVAVERFPVRVLLEENGIEVSSSQPTTDLSTFPSIGSASAVANKLVLRREKETTNQNIKTLDDVQVSSDGKELTFRLKTEIEVQKPELLLEQYGVSQLFRITIAKATLNSNDGNLMAIFASALEQDWAVDGPALEDVVRSFQATDQSSLSTST